MEGEKFVVRQPSYSRVSTISSEIVADIYSSRDLKKVHSLNLKESPYFVKTRTTYEKSKV